MEKSRIRDINSRKSTPCQDLDGAGEWTSAATAEMITPAGGCRTCILSVSNIRGEEARRNSLFHRFKHYGFIQGIDVQWAPMASQEGGTKVAYVYFDNYDSASAALKDHVLTFLLCQLWSRLIR